MYSFCGEIIGLPQPDQNADGTIVNVPRRNHLLGLLDYVLLIYARSPSSNISAAIGSVPFSGPNLVIGGFVCRLRSSISAL